VAILFRLVVTAVAGLFTYVTKKVPWLAMFGAIGVIGGAVLTVIQIVKELKALGWIS